MFCNNGDADRKLQPLKAVAGSDEDDSEADDDDRALSSVLLRIRQAYAATHGDQSVNYQVPEFARRLQEFELCDVTGDEWKTSIVGHAQTDDLQKDYLAPDFRLQTNASHTVVNPGNSSMHGQYRIVVGRVRAGLIVPPFLRPIEEETNPDGEVFPVAPDVSSSHAAVPVKGGRHCAREEARGFRYSDEQEQEEEQEMEQEEEEEEEENPDVEDTASYRAFNDSWFGAGKSHTGWMDLEERRETESGSQSTSTFSLQLRDLRSGRKSSTKDSATKDHLSDADDSAAAFQLLHDDRRRYEDTRTCSDELDRQGRRSNKGLLDAFIASQTDLPIFSRQDNEISSSPHAPTSSTSGSPRVLCSHPSPELVSDVPLPVHCACPLMTSLMEPSVILVEWLDDWTGLFFLLLTSGSTFVACLTSMPPSCLIAFISFAALISFPLRCHL